MEYIRALERGALGEISTCLLRYSHIASLVHNPYDHMGNISIKLRAIKDHVVDLARAQAFEALDQAAAIDTEGDRVRATRVRQKASRLLYKLAPGKGGSVGAIRCGGGALATDAASMAKVLSQYWGDVFRSRGVDEELLKTWVAEDIAVRQSHGELQPAMADVRLLRKHVAAAVHHSNNSCPGPDGIPYAAWRRLGDDAIDVLWTAMREMTEEESPPFLGGIKETLREVVLLFWRRFIQSSTRAFFCFFQKRLSTPLQKE